MDHRDILLCSEDTIKTYTNISDNICGDYLSPAIYVAQRTKLEGILGTSLTAKLQQLVYENKLAECPKYKELLDDYVTDYLCYASIAEVIPLVSFKIGNTGAARTDEEKTTNISYSEVGKLVDWYSDKADYFGMRMQMFLLDYYSDFPELSNSKISEIKSNLGSAANCQIWLGGERGKRG